MGLTVSRKTAKNLAVRRKNERILTVSRKKMLTVKKFLPQNKVSRSFVESDVLSLLCVLCVLAGISKERHAYTTSNNGNFCTM